MFKWNIISLNISNFNIPLDEEKNSNLLLIVIYQKLINKLIYMNNYWTYNIIIRFIKIFHSSI